VPLLFVLAMGKFTGVLGATGQGAFSDAAWATAYAGPGPWGSLAAEVPSHPSQAYEAIAVSAVIAFLAVASRLSLFRRRNGAILFLALGLWALVRIGVATTWRDPVAVGPLRMEQAMHLGVLAVALALLTVFALRRPARMPEGEVGPPRPAPV
jgi:prolipoprotein diacylglyceryltransferase